MNQEQLFPMHHVNHDYRQWLDEFPGQGLTGTGKPYRHFFSRSQEFETVNLQGAANVRENTVSGCCGKKGKKYATMLLHIKPIHYGETRINFREARQAFV
jgi:hypothetical protein